jgi:hypothetical protein
MIFMFPNYELTAVRIGLTPFDGEHPQPTGYPELKKAV